MNIHDLADKSILTLKTNFPNHPALKKDGSFDFNYYNRSTTSWFDRLTFGLLSSSQPTGFNTEELYKNAPQQ